MKSLTRNKRYAKQAARTEQRIASSKVIPPNRPVSHLPQPADLIGQEFLNSFAWKRLRMIALRYYGTKCMCCGATPENGAIVNVDHIKPRRFFPQLALDLTNLQILCHDCNRGKGSFDMTDWRPKKYRKF